MKKVLKNFNGDDMSWIWYVVWGAVFGTIAMVLIEVVFFPFWRGFLNGIRKKD